MAWFHDQPIRQKLLVTLLVASGTALFLAGVTILVWDQVLFRERLREDLSAVTDIIADNTTAALSFDDPRSASQTLLALNAKPHVVSACIFHADSSVLAR